MDDLTTPAAFEHALREAVTLAYVCGAPALARDLRALRDALPGLLAAARADGAAGYAVQPVAEDDAYRDDRLPPPSKATLALIRERGTHAMHPKDDR